MVRLITFTLLGGLFGFFLPMVVMWGLGLYDTEVSPFTTILVLGISLITMFTFGMIGSLVADVLDSRQHE